MKIIVVGGCGKVGLALTEQLSSEGHDVTIIDTNGKKLREITDSVDVMGVEGNGAVLDIQREAGVENADIFIAATSMDELNILCCLIARKTGQCHTIARVRNPEYTKQIQYIRKELNLSMDINPELQAAGEIARLIKFPSALKVDTFAKGKVELLKYAVPRGSALDGMKVHEIYSKMHFSVMVCAVESGKNVYIPDGNFVIHSEDKITLLSASKDILPFLHAIGISANVIRDVAFAGGGKLTYYLAKMLEGTGVNVKIIEKDPERCRELSETLTQAMIINGDASDDQLLLEEGINETDFFAALTGLDEENMLMSMYVSNLSKTRPRLVTKVNRTAFTDVLSHLELGSIISPKLVTADTIVRYVRSIQNSLGSNVETLVKIVGGKAEALEFRVEEGSRITGKPLAELKFIDNLLVACIHRNGKIIIPRGQDMIQAGDSVVVVTTHLGLGDIGDILDGQA